MPDIKYDTKKNIVTDYETGKMWDVSDPRHPVEIMPMQQQSVSDIGFWQPVTQKPTMPTPYIGGTPQYPQDTWQTFTENIKRLPESISGTAQKLPQVISDYGKFASDVPLWQRVASGGAPIPEALKAAEGLTSAWGEALSATPLAGGTIRPTTQPYEEYKESQKATLGTIPLPWSKEGFRVTTPGIMEMATPDILFPAGKAGKGANLLDDIVKALSKGIPKEDLIKALVESPITKTQIGRNLPLQEAEQLLKTAESKIAQVGKAIPKGGEALPETTVQGKLTSLFEGQTQFKGDTMTLTGAYRLAKERGIVQNADEFRTLLKKEVDTGLISGGSGTSSKSVENQRLGYPEKSVIGFIRKPQLKSPITLPGEAQRASTAAGGAMPPSIPPNVPPPINQGLAGRGDELQRMYDMLGQSRTKPPKDISATALKLQEQLNDLNYGLRRMQGEVSKATPITPGSSRDLSTLINRTPGVANAGATRYILTIDKIKKIAPDIIADDINAIINANHYKEVLAAKGTERVMAGGFNTASELDNVVAQLQVKLGSDKFNRAWQGAEVVRDVYKQELQRLVDGGLVAPDLAQELATKYPWYNPLQYIEDTEQLTALGKSAKPFNVIASGLKRLTEKGTEKAARAPLDVLADQLVKNEVRLHKNETAKSIIQLALEQPQLGVSKVNLVGPVANVDEKLILRPIHHEVPGVLSFFENGKRQNYQVPDWMYREAVTLQKAISNPVSSLIGSLNGISRAAFTSASPPFVVANMLNDSLTAFLSRGILPTETVSRLLKSLRGLEGDKVMQAFRLSGGYQMRFYGKDLAKDVIKSGGQIIKGNEGIGKKLLKLIPEAGEAGEQAPRMALFERQLNKTLPGWKQMTAEQIATTPQGRKAAADAVELTINFGRGGYLIKAANPFVIFLNANMEGMKLPFRVLRDNPAAHWRLAGVGAGIAGLTAYNLSHPEYFDIPNHIRWGSVVVMLPSKEKDSSGKPKPNYLTIIPRTREWGAFLGSETYAMEKMFSDNPTDFGKFSATMAPMLFPLAEIPMPAVLEELAGQAANWDFYRSQPIVPEEMQGLPSEQQVQPWVSPTMAAIANATGQSPLRAQHFMQGIFGGAGQTFTSIADYIASMVAPQQVDQRISNLAEQYKSLTGTIERNKFLMNLSQKDKDAIFAEMRKPQRGVPVVSPILRRVIPGQGGQLYRTGQELAEKETGLKPEQTRKVSGVLQNISNIYLERQKQIDKSFNGGQITGKQWRDSRAELGQRYQGALDSLGVQFPSAAQVQKDSSLADRYYQTIATLANTMPDSRERAAMLTAGWYAIDLQEIEPGEKDWNTFTRMRDGYKASLSASDKQLLDDYLQSKMTDVEKLYSQAQEVLKPYWEVPDKVWGSYPPELRQVADAIEKLEKTNPDMAKKILQQYPNILYVRKLIATVKKRYKEAMPAVQGALNIFYKY